jgi:hypothetical protein
MSVLFLVEAPDGTLIRKAAEDLLPDDMLVFDGPDATAAIDAAKARLDADIKAAGGLEAWRATAPMK